MSKSQILPGRSLVMLVVIAGLLSGTTLPTRFNAQARASLPATNPFTPAPVAKANEMARLRVSSAYAQLPVRFEGNQGQFDAQVKFAARGAGYALWLTGDESVMTLSGDDHRASAAEMARAVIDQKKPTDQISEEKAAVIRMKLVNSNRTPGVSGENELPGRSNYFIGNDPAKWRTDVSGYSRVVYKSVYRGVDLVYYGNGRELEYDFKVAAGANPGVIGIRFEGAKRLRVDPTGELVIGLETGEVRQHKPVVYQEAAGERREVSARYELQGKNQISFALGRYDHSKPLVIDPVLAYSTYLGGTSNESINAIAVDAAGNAYVTGGTISSDFPAINSIGGTRRALFVSKLNSAGNALIYSTLVSGYPGDIPGTSSGLAIAVDTTGNAYVTGQTDSTSFPTSPGAFQTVKGQSDRGGPLDAFVLKLSAAGSALAYSTYLGGGSNEIGKSIAVDSAGSAYVTGLTNSDDFPKANAMQPGLRGFQDAFVTKLNGTGSALVYSTFLGGIESESGNGIALDSAGSAYVTGGTSSSDFPTVNAIQPAYHGRGAFSSNDNGSNWAAVGNGFPITASTTAVAIDPSNSSVIYIGTSDHGLFKSTDAGGSWTPINNGVPDLTIFGFPGFYFPINDLEVDRNNPATLFVGMSANGILRSTDGGNSWSRKGGNQVISVKIDPTDSAIVYAANEVLGLLQSTDGGLTFEEISPLNPLSTYALAIAPTNPSTLYVGLKSGGIWRFGGGSPPQPLPFPINTPVSTLAVDPSTLSTIYAGTVSGLYKSTDSGNSWAPMNSGLLINGFIPSVIVALAIDPLSPNTVYATTQGSVFKSTDAGATWVQRSGLPTAIMYDVAIDPHATSHIFVCANIADDAFVTKLSATGSALVYSTYIGGLDIENGLGIAVDAARNVYVTGTTYSANIPGVSSAFPRRGIADAFAMKLSAVGTFSYFANIGGSVLEQGSSIAIDSAGNSYITGYTTSSDFPTTVGAIPVAGSPCAFCSHSFVTKLNSAGTTMLYSSYLGGNPVSPGPLGITRERGMGIAVDSGARIYVAGQAFSTNFPVTAGAFDTTHNGSGDGFVAKLNLFDVCMQDDTNGNLLRFSSTTGDYLFTNCRKGTVYAGRGSVTTNFCKITLNARMADQTLNALANTCTRAASAELVAQGKTLTITDKDMGNDSCGCQ